MKRLIALLLCVCLLCFPVRAASGEKLVALSFDDGPSGKYTRRLMAGLEDRNVKATFFLCGYRMAQYPELTEQIFLAGHEIGLHGYSHKPMDTMCRRDITQEIEKSMAMLPEDCKVAFLRSPGGVCGQCVQAVASDKGLAILCWSVDPRDWAKNDAAAIKNEVIRNVRDGDVILLHDMSDSSVDAALEIIDELRSQGFRFVTASQLAQARHVPLVPGKKYTRFDRNV